MNQITEEIILLTEKEAIKKLNISFSTIRRYRKIGILTYNKFGGAIRYEMRDLQTFINKTKKQNQIIIPASKVTLTVTNN